MNSFTTSTFSKALAGFAIFAVVDGGSACNASEGLTKVAGRRKSGDGGNLTNGIIGFLQQLLAFFHSPLHQILDGRDAEGLLEGVRHIILILMGLLGQKIQADGLLKMAVDVILDCHALGAYIIKGSDGYVDVFLSQNEQKNDVQQILTNGFLTWPADLNFILKRIDEIRDAAVSLRDMYHRNILLLGDGGGKLQSLNAENDIFQRLVFTGKLTVLNLRVDDNQMILFNRAFVALYKKVSLPAGDVEELGKAVAVQGAVPVVFIARAG